MEASILLFMKKLKKIGMILLSLIETLLLKTQKKIISLCPPLPYSNFSEENDMSKKHKFYETQQQQTVEQKEEVMETKEDTIITVASHDYSKNAYSIVESGNKYHVISVSFDPITLASGRAKVIESNTDRFLMQERLQVLLLGDDVL
jgi:hypothetical protein